MTQTDAERMKRRMAEKKNKSLWDAKIIRRALVDALVKLDPRTMMKNPVMFVVEVGSVVAPYCYSARSRASPQYADHDVAVVHSVIREFAEAMAEGRGKAQADTLRKARSKTVAKRLLANGQTETVASSKLRSGDVVVVSAGELVPGTAR